MQDNDMINEYANIESRDQKEEPPQKKENKEKDAKLSLMLTQLAICALALLTVFALKLIGGEPYNFTRTEYIEHFEKHTTIEEVTAVLANVFDETASSAQNEESSASVISDALVASVASENTKSSSESKIGTSSVAEGLLASEATSETAEEVSVNSATNGSEDEEFLPDLTSQTSTDMSQSKTATALSAEQLAVGSILRTSNTKLISANSMAVPVNGEITSLYGLREHPIYGEELFHAGVDIGADEGSEIFAALSGTVIKVGKDSGYGNYTVISHTNGLKTLYAHCSKILVSEGDDIQKGKTIALVGNTGVSTGPHLHFEVILNGVNLNPLWFL